MNELVYFAGVRTIAQGETRYRTLARRLHPDNKRTGDAEAFIAMKKEWDVWNEVLERKGEIKRKPGPKPVARPRARSATPVPSEVDVVLEVKEREVRESLHRLGVSAADYLLASVLGTRGE